MTLEYEKTHGFYKKETLAHMAVYPMPIPPDGEGWRLVASTSVGERNERILFFWERETFNGIYRDKW